MSTSSEGFRLKLCKQFSFFPCMLQAQTIFLSSFALINTLAPFEKCANLGKRTTAIQCLLTSISMSSQSKVGASQVEALQGRTPRFCSCSVCGLFFWG
jgi:hypothetical protein